MSEDSVLIRFTWGVEGRGKSEDVRAQHRFSNSRLRSCESWGIVLVFFLVASVLCVPSQVTGCFPQCCCWEGWLCTPGTASCQAGKQHLSSTGDPVAGLLDLWDSCSWQHADWLRREKKWQQVKQWWLLSKSPTTTPQICNCRATANTFCTQLMPVVVGALSSDLISRTVSSPCCWPSHSPRRVTHPSLFHTEDFQTGTSGTKLWVEPVLSCLRGSSAHGGPQCLYFLESQSLSGT